MTDELKKCPFCGGEAKFNSGSKIYCDGEWCNAIMIGVQGKKLLAENWNKRVKPAPTLTEESIEKFALALNPKPVITDEMVGKAAFAIWECETGGVYEEYEQICVDWCKEKLRSQAKAALQAALGGDDE